MKAIGLALLAVFILTACGQKRALYLPEEPNENGLLASMPIGRMPDIVKQRQGLDEVLIQTNCPSDSTCNRRHLLGVRKTRAMIVAHLTGKYLHLAT